MKHLTVKQLAVLSGITVRTLHHYDEVGLLKPAVVGTNGYRYYGRDELLRLQRILFHRELNVPLAAIAELLDLEEEDQLAVLRQHRHKLAAEQERYGVLIETIDRTIADLTGGKTMANAQLYAGFSPDKQAGYEAWLIERYGDEMRTGIEHAKIDFAKMLPAQRKAALASCAKELQEIEGALADALRHAVEPGSEAADLLLRRHRGWVTGMWGRPCSAQAYAALAELYLAHPDFVARYERLEKGFAQYLARAMKIHANKWRQMPTQTE